MRAPPQEDHRTPRAVCRLATSIVVEDGAEAALLGEQGIAAEIGLVEIERLIGLLLAVARGINRDRLRRLSGFGGQRAGLGDLVRARPGNVERYRLGLGTV